MIGADHHLKLLSSSIVDIHKKFDDIDMLSTGIE
jgi:hypothetical protein